MNFKKIFSGMALLSLMVGTSVAQATDIKDFPRVAVMNFGNKAITSKGLRDQDFSSAAEYAIYQLSASGWFDLIDYEQLSTIANMHSINMSGLVDPATTVEIGKFAGAEYMVVGYLTGLTTKENVFGYQHGDKGGFDNAQHVVTANVAVRIVDIKTGRIIVAGLGNGSSTSTYTELKFTKYRNRKVETEDISNTVTRDQKDEYTRNSNTTNNQSNTYDKNTQNTTPTDDSSNSTNENETTETQQSSNECNSSADETINMADNVNTVLTNNKNISYERDQLDYVIKIGTVEVSDIQVRNAISKAVRDAIYGNMGIMTTLNNGKKLKIKTGF